MKLRLSSSLLAALLATHVWADGFINTVSLSELPVKNNYNDWAYFYEVIDANILATGGMASNQDGHIYIGWNAHPNEEDINQWWPQTREPEGDRSAIYTLTGNCTLNAEIVSLHMGYGTYVFNGKISVNSIYDEPLEIRGAGEDCHLVIDTSMEYAKIRGFQTVTIRNNSLTVPFEFTDVETLYAPMGVSSKKVSNLLTGGIRTIVGDVSLDGSVKGMKDKVNSYGAPTRVKGNVHIANKMVFFHEVSAYMYANSGGHRGWFSEPDEESIRKALEQIDGTRFVSCDSYTGSPSNLTVQIFYQKHLSGCTYDEYYGYGCTTSSVTLKGNYGMVLPLYNAEEGCYDIQFKAYWMAEQASELTPSVVDGAHVAYLLADSLYLSKTLNLSPNGSVTLTWNGAAQPMELAAEETARTESLGKSICLMGKGAISAKQGLTVELKNCYFTLASTCSFKNADYVVDSALFSAGAAITGGAMSLTDGSTLDLCSGKLTLKDKLLIEGGSKAEIRDAVSCGSLDIKDGSHLHIEDSNHLKPKAMGLTVKGSVEISDTAKDDDAELSLTGKLSAAMLEMTNADIVLTSAKPQSISLTLTKDALKQPVDNKLTNSSITANGSMTVAGNLETEDSRIKLWDETLTKPKAQNLTVKGTLGISDTIKDDDAELELTGKLSAAMLEMTNADIVLTSATPQSISLTQAKNAFKQPANNFITDSSITANGSMTVAGNLMLNNSHIRLRDQAVTKPKPQNLTVKNSFILSNGASLTLSGTLSAADMVLDGGTITMIGSKHTTIKVASFLTLLDNGVKLYFDDGVVNGESYKIFTFKAIGDSTGEWDAKTKDLYTLLGLDREACELILDEKRTCITMNVKNAELLKSDDDDDMDDSVAASDSALVAPTALVQQDYSPLADALVQGNWGMVETSRAFVNTIANRSMAVQLGSGERAVWASAIGGSSRRSSNASHYGADTSITGGAIGMETQLGESSLLGAALGNSWTRVSAHGFGKIKQDTTHFGLYGQTNWGVLSADWSAAYGRSESRSNGSSWNQHSIQLDARLSYNHALTDNTLLRGFAGAQYYGHDSATVDGIETGKVQNLRAEVGVGIVRYTEKSSVYAEVALLQDVARHNPEVRTPDGQRYRGLNPGRTGVNITVGGSYALSDQWSVNASYTAEVVENANAHSVNVGATYKF